MKKHTLNAPVGMFLMLFLSLTMLFGCKKKEEDNSIPPPKSFPGYMIGSEGDPIVGKSIKFRVSPRDPITVLWDFGDGSTSTNYEGWHTYVEPGSYTVSMIPDGDRSKMATYKISIYCFVNMKYSGNCVVGDSIQFFNTCSVQPTSAYLWEFGDSTTSTAPAPKHAYAAVGFYTVRLTLNGSYSTTKLLNIY